MFLKMTLRDAYNYDNTIFYAIRDAVPQNTSADTLITHVITRAGGRYVGAYSIEVLRTIITDVANTKKYDWDRIQTALTADYSPIENVFEHTEYTDGEETSTAGTSTSTSTSTSTDTGTTSAAAYDGDTLKQTGSTQGTAGSSGDTNASVNNRLARTFTHAQDRHGNIGVTSNQQMITQEMIMRKTYNIYDIMADDIINATTLEVY